MPRDPWLNATPHQEVGLVSGSSGGTSLTANASANTKATSYTQLIASTSRHADGLWVFVSNPNVANIDFLIDIAVGAASSEKDILSNWQVSGGTGAQSFGSHVFIPCSIQSGIRISARCQCSTGSSTIRVLVVLASGGVLPGNTPHITTTYGAATGDSGGTSIDPGGSANTFGTKVVITSSTTFAAKFMAIAIGNQLNSVRSTQRWVVRIAVGGAGAEKDIFTFALDCATSADIVCPQSLYMIPVDIKAGSRITAYAESSGTDATDRLFDLSLYLTAA